MQPKKEVNVKEHFHITQVDLFQKMGLEARQTQASRDGGVDCVALSNFSAEGSTLQ
jgi:hypothetical protein